ncbi:MAG: molybdate ABC transporter substrate-binding protein [Acidobacteria bacterium]|nr:molybdate ABC transporter substrate-binding protein [Acidobacteriota bacterium]
MLKRLWALGPVLALAVAMTACGDGEAGSDTSVLVFAAASLTDAFTEVESAFEATNPGIGVQVNFAGSSSLREQILEGAPADVFASANEAIMVELVNAGEVSGEPLTFARNRMQIAVPAGNPGGVSRIEDFADGDLLIGLCAQGVPCGNLAREVLSNAGVEPSIDTNEPDVRALVTKIEEDELDAGLVYVSDVATAEDLVEGIDIPEQSNVVAEYPIAALAHAPNPKGASAFVDFLLSAEGQAILSAAGFGAA